MSLNDFTGDKKSYSKTGIGLFTFSFGTVKAFKNFFLVFLVNTNTIVFYTDRYMIFYRCTDGNIYLIRVWRIFNSIIQQVDNYLRNSIFICTDRGVMIVIQIYHLPGLSVKNILYHVNHKLIQLELFNIKGELA